MTQPRWPILTALLLLLLIGLAMPSLWQGALITPGNYTERLQPPTAIHWFGTDGLGRDLFRLTVMGLRNSLAMSLAAVGLGCLVGTSLGILAGYVRSWTDLLIGWLTDILLAFPSILLAIALITVLGPGLLSTTVAVAIVQVPIFIRLSRAQVLALREQAFVEAVQALGASPLWLMGQHLLPASLPALLVQAALMLGTATLEAAGLGFLGLSAQPPTPELGTMLADAFTGGYALSAPWTILSPGLMLMVMVLLFNSVGEQLRQQLAPKSQQTFVT